MNFSDHVLRTMAKTTRLNGEEIVSFIHENKCVPVGGRCSQTTSAFLFFSHKDNKHLVVSYRATSKTILDIIPADRYRESMISMAALDEAERLASGEVHICPPGSLCCGEKRGALTIYVKFVVRKLKSDRTHELFWRSRDPVLDALGSHFPDDDRAHTTLAAFVASNIRDDETFDATYYRIGKQGNFIPFTLRGL